MPTGKPGTRSIPRCHPEAEYQAKGTCKTCYQIEYRKTHPYIGDTLDKNAKRRFGISGKNYTELREKQREEGDLCGVCKQPLGNADTTPSLDHNHETGKIREFCHRTCNMALGLLQDSPEICRLAAEYLERHQEISNGNGN
jgi:hypothetical protein